MHDVEPDQAEARMSERLRHRADDREPERAVERDGSALLSATALNCIARNPAARAQARASSTNARPRPRPRAVEATMKLALATCAPGPSRFAYMLAVPSTSARPGTTVVRPGESTIQSARARASVIRGSYVKVSPARTTSRTTGQIAGQSDGVASRTWSVMSPS